MGSTHEGFLSNDKIETFTESLAKGFGEEKTLGQLKELSKKADSCDKIRSAFYGRST